MTTKSQTKSKAKSFPFQPLNDRVVVLPDEEDKVSKGGIHLPDGHDSEETTLNGVVVAVGPGGLDEKGYRIPVCVGQGDRVIYRRARYGMLEEVVGGDTVYHLVKEDALLAVVEETTDEDGA